MKLIGPITSRVLKFQDLLRTGQVSLCVRGGQSGLCLRRAQRHFSLGVGHLPLGIGNAKCPMPNVQCPMTSQKRSIFVETAITSVFQFHRNGISVETAPTTPFPAPSGAASPRAAKIPALTGLICAGRTFLQKCRASRASDECCAITEYLRAKLRLVSRRSRSGHNCPDVPRGPLLLRQAVIISLILGLLSPVLAQETPSGTTDAQVPAGELRTEHPTSNHPAIQQSGPAGTAGGVASTDHAAAPIIHHPSSTSQQPDQTAMAGQAAPTNQAAPSTIYNSTNPSIRQSDQTSVPGEAAPTNQAGALSIEHPTSNTQHPASNNPASRQSNTPTLQHSNTPPLHQSNEAAPRIDFSAFKIVAERNIFDPNRQPHEQRPPPAPAPKVIDSFALVGVISYFRGTFALFDGTEPQYRKGLKLNDRIAGYTVAGISPNSVKLTSGGKEIVLRIGMQLSREEHGPWVVGTQAVSYASSSSSPSSMSASDSDPTPHAHLAGADRFEKIRERLMKQRQQEEKGK